MKFGIPWSFCVFSASFPGFLSVPKVREILGVFEVFVGIFEKTKNRKDKVVGFFQSKNFVRKGFSIQIGCQSGVSRGPARK